MAEILTQRAALLSKIETTFGVDPTPTPSADAMRVSNPQYEADQTEIVRDFARNSISQLPSAAGRAIGKITFDLEVASNGAYDGSTAPRVGALLRACGFAETGIVTNGTTNGRSDVTADSGNGGPATTWAAGGSNAILRELDYRIRVTLGGASATAEMRVTGGGRDEDLQTDSSQERDAILTETFCVETVTELGTITGAATVDDATDPQSVEYDFTGLGGLTIGDQFRVTVLGIPFLVTVTVATPTGLGDDVEAAVDAHPAFNAANAAGVVTVTFTGDAASTAITSGSTALTLGASGHTVTPTWAGNQVLNDGYTAVTKPTGFEYTPISDSFESATHYLYLGGVLHTLTGSRGTATMAAKAGDIAKWSFEFQGNYQAVEDAAVPTGTFETTIPSQVELAELQVNPAVDDTAAASGIVCDTWEDQVNGIVDTLCADAFSLDIGNNVVPRSCVNEADGFNGVTLTGREVKGSFDPELELVATHDYWALRRSADVMSWQAQVGTVRGNVVRFESDSVQYTGLDYGDRDGLRVVNVDLRFSAPAPSYEDGELVIRFC